VYPIVKPPVGTNFSDMGKAELKEYNDWFFQVKLERLGILTSASGLTESLLTV
jgi:hypothetical protein